MRHAATGLLSSVPSFRARVASAGAGCVGGPHGRRGSGRVRCDPDIRVGRGRIGSRPGRRRGPVRAGRAGTGRHVGIPRRHRRGARLCRATPGSPAGPRIWRQQERPARPGPGFSPVVGTSRWPTQRGGSATPGAHPPRRPGIRGRRRPPARRPAGGPTGRASRRPGRPARRRCRCVVRRGARAHGGRDRPAHRHRGPGRHVERPRRRVLPAVRGDTRGCQNPRRGRPRGCARPVQTAVGVALLRFGRRTGGRLRRASRAFAGDLDVVAEPGVRASTPTVCRLFLAAAETGTPEPELVALLHAHSPRAVLDGATAPTLLVQGMADTLFGIEQSDASARTLASRGGAHRGPVDRRRP